MTTRPTSTPRGASLGSGQCDIVDGQVTVTDVEPQGAATVAKALRRLISQAFPGCHVAVLVYDDVAVLTGCAPTFTVKQCLIEQVEAHGGIGRVVDEIRVGEVPRPWMRDVSMGDRTWP